MPRITKYGDYYLTSHLATGGMAELFRAHKMGEAGFEKMFAIKRLLPHLARNQDFVTMFLDEARLASQLNHQNIVQVYDLGRIAAGPEVEPLAGDTYFIAMEYVFGKNLAEIYRAAQERQAMLSSDNLVKVIMNVAVALDYAHSLSDHNLRPLGVVHRDISPANILLSYEGEIKLVDFGIAKALSQSSATKPGVLKGKFAYMSPEQAKGLPVDARSDIFSLGIVLWEGLTGQRLFAADNEAAILKKVVEAEVPPPSQAGADSPPGLDAICLKCLAVDRAARYQSAQEMAQDLEEYLRSLSTYPSTYSLRSHLFTLFAERIDQEREEIRAENETLKRMLAGEDAAQTQAVTTQRSHPVYTPKTASGVAAGPATSVPSASAPPTASGARSPSAAPMAAPSAPPAAPAASSQAPEPAPAKKSRGWGKIVGGVVVGLVGVLVFLYWVGSHRPTPPPPATQASPAGPAPYASPAAPAVPVPPSAASVPEPSVTVPASPPAEAPASPAPPGAARRQQAAEHLRAGGYQEAWDILQALAASEPGLAPQLVPDQVAALLGLAKAGMDETPTAALAWLDRARQLAPDAAEVHFQSGRAHTKLERLEEALAAYRRAVELSPQLAGAYFNMGYILLKLERVPQAVTSFQKVVDLGGELVEEALTNLGVCYARLGDRDKAAAMFSQALAKNPDNLMAKRYLEQVRGAGAGRDSAPKRP